MCVIGAEPSPESLQQGGLHVRAGGTDIEKLIKTPLIYSFSFFNLEGLGALFGKAKPTKVVPPRGDGTDLET